MADAGASGTQTVLFECDETVAGIPHGAVVCQPHWTVEELCGGCQATCSHS